MAQRKYRKSSKSRSVLMPLTDNRPLHRMRKTPFLLTVDTHVCLMMNYCQHCFCQTVTYLMLSDLQHTGFDVG